MTDRVGSLEKSLEHLALCVAQLDAEMKAHQLHIGPKRGAGNDQDKPEKPAKKTTNPAEGAMTLVYTGMLQGETATMTESKVMVARFRLVRGFIQPADIMDHSPDREARQAIYRAVLERVKHRKGRYFESVKGVMEFMQHTQRSGSYQFISESPRETTLIRFLELKPKDPKLISQEDIAYLLSNDVHPWDALMRFSPASESAANTHRRRLVMLLKYWTVDVGQKSPPLVIIRHADIISDPRYPNSGGSSYGTVERKEAAMAEQGRPNDEPYEGAINMDTKGNLLGPGGVIVKASSSSSSSSSSASASAAAAGPSAMEQDVEDGRTVAKVGATIYDMSTVPPTISVAKGDPATETTGPLFIHAISDSNECYIRFDSGHLSGEQAMRDDPYVAIYEPQMRHTPERLLSREKADSLREMLEPMSPSILKSLMQKIIRFAPHSVQMDANLGPEGIFAAENVLIWVMIVTMLKRPSFNPVTGTQERGVHAIIKRVVIACIEDAWPQSSLAAVLSKLAIAQEGAGAEAIVLYGMLQTMAINSDTKFWPSRTQLLGWIVLARSAVRSRSAWKYDASTPTEPIARPPSSASSPAEQMALASYLLDNYVKGMSGDLLMVRDVARQTGGYGNFAVAATWPRPPELIMPVWHCLDQHDFPVIIYNFNPKGEVARVTRTSGSIRTAKAFADLFSLLFRNVTGLNPRRENLGTTDLYGRGSRMSTVGPEFVTEVAAAQRMSWRILSRGASEDESERFTRTADRDPRRLINPAAVSAADAPRDMDASVELALTLPYEWLGYAINTHEFVDKKKTYIYNISPSDNDLHVARKDQRTTKDALGKVTRTAGSGSDEALLIEQETARIAEAILTTQLLAAPITSLPGVFVASDALLAPSGMIRCTRDPETQALSFEVSPDGVKPYAPWTESFPISLFVKPINLSAMPLNPLNFNTINRFAYLTSVGGWDPAATVSSIRTAVANLGVSASAILDGVAQLRSFAREINFPQPGRDGGASDDEIPSFMQYEVCQIIKVVAAFCPMAIRPLAYEGRARVNRFTTDESHLMLRRFIGSAIDPALQNTPVQDLMSDRVRPLIGDRRFNAMIRDLRSVWRSSQNQQLWLHQQQCAERYLVRANYQRRRHNFMNLPPGAGKTDISGAIFKGLLIMHQRRDPDADDASDDASVLPSVGHDVTDGIFMLMATTSAALETVTSLLTRIMPEGKVIMLNRARAGTPFEMPRTFRAGYVYTVKHDLLRDFSDDLMPHMARCYFCVDEVHMATGKTSKRTDRMLLLSRVSLYTLAMTGTPLRSKRDESTLRRWIQLGTRFPCRTANDFLVALSDVIQYPVVTDVSYDADGNAVNTFVQIATISASINVETNASEPERALIWANVPMSAGGTHQAPRFSNAMFDASYRASRTVCTRAMLDACIRIVRDPTQRNVRPFIVAENAQHLQAMYETLSASMPQETIFAFGISNGGSRTIPLNLLSTPGPYRVCLMLANVNTGYSGAWFNLLMRCVYPSNAASREQMEGRLVRPGQTVSPVRLETYHAGITSLMLAHHIDASNFNKMMRELNGIVTVIDDE